MLITLIIHSKLGRENKVMNIVESMKNNLRNLKFYSIILALVATLIFDFSIASGSIMPFRLIYDIAFSLIDFVVIYISILLLKNKELSENSLTLTLPKIFSLLPILMNIKAIGSIAWLDVPNIGILDRNILVQGIRSLFPLLDYLVIILMNGVILYVAIDRKTDKNVYEIPTYVLGIIAIEVIIANYCFHFGGVAGIRWGLSFFHLAFCGLVAWLYYKRGKEDIHITLGYPEILLGFLSLGILMMIYVPFGLYNHFTDASVVTAGAISILQRESLLPYYKACGYYSPIASFVSVVFSYTSGLDNILLSSALPFLVAHLVLPFVIYHFLKSFVIDESRMAIMGTIMTLLMDGLAVILLPAYVGNITERVITWRISPATMSLYSSHISHLWLTPYKALAMASAIAGCSMLHKRSSTDLLLGGALFFLSFVNPRYSYTTILLLLFLFGIEKIDIKEIATFILATLILFGPLLLVIISKISIISLYKLETLNLISNKTFEWLVAYFVTLREHVNTPSPLSIVIILISMVGVAFLLRSKYKNKVDFQSFTAKFIPKKSLMINLKIGWKKRGLRVSLQEVALIGISIAVLTYDALQAYKYIPNIIPILNNNILIQNLNYIILRWHIMIVLFIISLLIVKFDHRISITLISLALLTIIGSIFLRAQNPIIFMLMAIHTFDSLVKSQKKLGIFTILFFVLLGVFSATLYSATVKTSEAESKYVDMPYVLRILINEDPDERVYAYRSYNPQRAAAMANLKLSNDPSLDLYMFDKTRTNSTVIELLRKDNDYKILYEGDTFILFKRVFPINK